MARPWKSTELDLLQKCVAQQITFAQMVGLFDGRSRSALIGAAHRLGLKTVKGSMVGCNAPQAVASPAPSAPSPMSATRERRPSRAARDLQPPMGVEHFQTPVTPLPAEPAPEGGVLLLDLKPQHCRWPINDGGPYRFCGAHKEAGVLPYCAHHRKMRYRRPGDQEARVTYPKPKVSAFNFRA